MKSGEIKLFIAICVVALMLVAVAVYPMWRHRGEIGRDPDVPVKTDYSRAKLIPAWSRMQGDPKAPYTLVEFGDYQCPSCATGKYTVKDVLEKYKGKMNHVFHHVQITPEHNWAPLLARAAEAAGKQGKFWEFHREVFESQGMFTHADEKRVMAGITQIAKKVRVDPVKLLDDIQKPESGKLIGQMEVLAREVKVDTTPTYFLVPPKGEATAIGNTSALEDFLAKPDTLK